MSQWPVDEGELLYDVRDNIGRIVFNRPHALNAFTFPMYEQLAQICENAQSDPSVKVLIMTGAGDKAFASGTDIRDLRNFNSPQDSIDYDARISRILRAVEDCRVPTIAAIAGACMGGGAAIASCCDLRIGTEAVKFGFPIAKTLGNCMSADSLSRISALIGMGRIKEIIFTARLLNGYQAQQAGFLNEVVSDVPALRTRADDLAKLLAGHAPLTLYATKKALSLLHYRKPNEEIEALVRLCYMSEDFSEGIDAFLNKRAPVWKGE